MQLYIQSWSKWLSCKEDIVYNDYGYRANLKKNTAKQLSPKTKFTGPEAGTVMCKNTAPLA